MNQAPKTIVPSCIACKPRQGEPRHGALDVSRWALDYSHLTPRTNLIPSPLTPVLSFQSPPRGPSFGVLAAQTKKPLAKLGNMTKLANMRVDRQKPWPVQQATGTSTASVPAVLSVSGDSLPRASNPQLLEPNCRNDV